MSSLWCKGLRINNIIKNILNICRGQKKCTISINTVKGGCGQDKVMKELGLSLLSAMSKSADPGHNRVTCDKN